MHTLQKEKMITTKMLNNDLIAMEKQGLIKKAGYKYNSAGDPERRYELTEAGSEKFWAYELEHLSDADTATLERCGYGVTAEGLKLYIEETQP
jgi:DNA-binding HxlR family transcriptional regulator